MNATIKTKKANIVILGATGSIGQSTLDVISRHHDKYTLFAVTANKSVKKMFEICRAHKPKYAVMVDDVAAKELTRLLRDESITVLSGMDKLVSIAAHEEADMVMASIVGAAGLAPTLAAVETGKRVLLANKEALVTAGHLFIDAVKKHNTELLPIDSEHNAIFQCLPFGKDHESVRKILLTASGGPFRQTPLDEFSAITPAQACAHPNWDMGRKISVDSATMMNKGLELIEACWLFDKQASDIDIIVHPQSVIHSMVAYNDGSVIAQLGNPDMRTPIAYGLAWPERIDSGVELLDIIAAQSLTFEAPDELRFPCLRLARQAWDTGGNAAAVMNAANEIAVEAFLEEKISFVNIAEIVEETLNIVETCNILTLDDVTYFDKKAREVALNLL